MGFKGLTKKEERQATIKSYEDHPIIRQIKDMINLANYDIGKRFSFNLVTTNEIKHILRNLNAKETLRIDSI